MVMIMVRSVLAMLFVRGGSVPLSYGRAEVSFVTWSVHGLGGSLLW